MPGLLIALGYRICQVLKQDQRRNDRFSKKESEVLEDAEHTLTVLEWVSKKAKQSDVEEMKVRVWSFGEISCLALGGTALTPIFAKLWR